MNEVKIFKVHPPMKSHILFYSRPNGLDIWHGFPNITHNKVNMSHFLFDIEIFQGISLLETAHIVS